VLALLTAILTIVFARTSIRKIESQASELSRVSWHMLQSQELMARRFSHELHDKLGQSLAAVKANLSAGHSSDWPSRRADCLESVDSAIANVRELSQLLHPVILDDFGLDAGLRWLTDGFAQRTDIRTDYVSTFQGRLDDETETHLFRIA
jgi:signal transduction histidine kinase